MSNHPNRSRRKDRAGRNPRPAEIAQTREEAGLTQTQAAELIYSTLRTWQDWEGGQRRMHPALWEYWCMLYAFDEVREARLKFLRQ